MSLPEDLFRSYLEDEDLLPSLAGKTVTITGTTSGLGFALARFAIVKKAALVLLLNRRSERSEKSAKDLHQYVVSGAETAIQTIDCDLQSFDSVRKAAEEVNREVKPHGGLDVLCLNAGTMVRPDDRTPDGFDVQMQTNQLSHFLLTSLVYPSLKDAAAARGEARVVPQSSKAREMTKSLEARYFRRCDPGTLGGNKKTLLGGGGLWARYAQSKLANAAFAMALHRKLAASGSKVKSIACEPGMSVTGQPDSKQQNSSIFKKFGQSAADGCLSAAVACFGPDAQSGDFYAPGGSMGMTGRPVRVVAGGVRQKTGWIGGTDKATCDPEQQKLLWEACEKALGVEFVV